MNTKESLLRSFLVTFSVLLTIVTLEVVAKFFFGPVPDPTARVLYFSANALTQSDCGAVHYTPNRSIRSVAIYGNHVEYDVTFKTNNAGYIDSQDYFPTVPFTPKRRIAFVGDSFTAGFHAGKPWIAQLRKTIRNRGLDVALYNFGVSGTGLSHFSTRLKCESNRADFNEIVIAALTDDLDRREWIPREYGQRLLFCKPSRSVAECSEQSTSMFVLPHDTVSQDQLVANAHSVYQQKVREVGIRTWLKRTYTGHAVASVRTLFGRGRTKQHAANLLNRIRRDFPDRKIMFLHLPTRVEVKEGSYELNIGRVVRESGIEYFPALRLCEFTEEGYFRRDSHPNEKGYDQITDCVEHLLGLK